MNCNKCGFLLEENSKFCPNCGNQIIDNISISNEEMNKSFFKQYKKIMMICGIILIILLITLFIIFVNSQNKRADELTNIEESNYVKFKLEDDELYLGKEVSSYISKGYSYDTEYITDEDYILGDSISMQTFYKDDEAKFLGVLYCPKKDKCTYKESTLVKINFYEDQSLLIDEFLKYGLYYDDIVEKYGKEDGKFYQNNELLVWSFGEKGKIGEPYYILRFDKGGLFSTGKLTDIRIGVWWYDGEYEHTIINEYALCNGGESCEEK